MCLFLFTAAIVVQPNNTVTLVGTGVRFVCATELNSTDAIRWNYYPSNGSSELTVIYSGTKINHRLNENNRFKISTDGAVTSISGRLRHVDLVISDVKMSDAGTYACLETTRPNQCYGASLIVLGNALALLLTS